MERRTPNRQGDRRMTWSEDLLQRDRPELGSSADLAIDTERYEAPSTSESLTHSFMSLLENVAQAGEKGGMAAMDNKKYLRTRYQLALQVSKATALGRQLAYILIDANYNHVMKSNYHFKGDYAYMNAYDTAIKTLRNLSSHLVDDQVDIAIIGALGRLIDFITAQQAKGIQWSITKLRILQRFDLYCHTLDLERLTRASDNEEDQAYATAGLSTDTPWKPGQAKVNHSAWQQRGGTDNRTPTTKKPRPDEIQEVPPSEQCRYHLALWAKNKQTNRRCTHRFEGCTAFGKLPETAQQAFLQSGTLPGKQ